MPASPPPTLYTWAGGQEALERLTTRFYQNVAGDPLLAPLFAHMDQHHPRFVAQFIAEVFGGPALYSAKRGGHPHMIQAHLERHLTESQRRRSPGPRSMPRRRCLAGGGARRRGPYTPP